MLNPLQWHIYTALNDSVLSCFSNYSALSVFTCVRPPTSNSVNYPFLSVFKILPSSIHWALFIVSVPYAFCNTSNFPSEFFFRVSYEILSHLCLKTCEMSFCSAIAKQISYNRSYKHALRKTTTFELLVKTLEEAKVCVSPCDQSHRRWGVSTASIIFPPLIFIKKLGGI